MQQTTSPFPLISFFAHFVFFRGLHPLAAIEVAETLGEFRYVKER